MNAATERFSMVPAALLEHSGLKGREKVVLVALLSFCDRAGVCFPSLARLAKTAGLSTATVKRSLCLLESQGLLSRKRRMSPEGDYTSSLYTLGGLAQIEPTLAQIEPRVGSNCTNGLAQDELRMTFPGNPGHRFTRRISRFRSFPGSCTRFRNEAAFCCRTFLYT